jgi:hypothetical protein
MTKSGQYEMASWIGYGIGRFGPGGRVSFRGSVFYRTNSTGKLSFLNNLVAAFEYEIDEAWNTHCKRMGMEIITCLFRYFMISLTLIVNV